MKAVILGTRGAGRLALDTLRCSKADDVEVAGFIDDAPEARGQVVMGVPVFGTFAQLPELMKLHKIDGFFLGFSDNLMKLREERFEACLRMGLQPFNIIHPSVLIAPSVKIGTGVFIGTGVMAELDAEIGDNCSIHMGSTIGHDCVLEKNVWLSGGVNLAGAVKIGPGVRLGTGANVIPKCRLGRNSTVGAGAVVIDDVPDNVTVVGVPARIMDRQEK